MQSKTTGIGLIAIGTVMMLYTGFGYVTTEKVVDLGPIKINKEKNHFVEWPPVIGSILLIGGVIILLRNKNKDVM